MFEVRDLSLSFGGIVVLDGLSFRVEEGELCALIGPNGAGKSSLFNCISGVYQPQQGSVTIAGEQVLRRRPHEIAKLGVGRTFQNLALVPTMTVLENVLLGGHLQHRHGMTALGGLLRLPTERRGEAELRAEAEELLKLTDLWDWAQVEVSSLPFGWQKRAELARAMMAHPRLLLVDEPASGLTHDEVNVLGELIQLVHSTCSLTTLLVEHHMGLVQKIATSCVVLNAGQLIAEGAPRDVVNNPAVIAAYLGESA